MSIAQKLAEKLTIKKTSVHERYVRALATYCRHPDDPEAEQAALAAAEASGLSPAQVEEDSTKFAQAATLAETAERLPALMKQHRVAIAAVERANSELERVKAPLENAVDSAAFEAGKLEKQVMAARAAIAALVGLVNGSPDLLGEFRSVPPVADFIAADKQRIERERLEREQSTLRVARDRAAAEVVIAEGRVQHWPTDDLKTFPIPADWMREEKAAVREAEKRLAEVDGQIAELETRLAKMK